MENDRGTEAHWHQFKLVLLSCGVMVGSVRIIDISVDDPVVIVYEFNNFFSLITNSSFPSGV